MRLFTVLHIWEICGFPISGMSPRICGLAICEL
jgi:hypothetical protein